MFTTEQKISLSIGTGIKMNEVIFICQITENILKLIKFQRDSSSRGALLGLGVEALAPGIAETELAKIINQALKKLEYKNSPVIISLSRNYATCRYLRVPTQTPGEIEKIIALQAATYLPYPANELITSFEVISTDKEGYSYINMVIVHKDIIERYIKLFKELKITNLSIVLSSYGACNLYSYINPQAPGPAMLIDIDSHQVELAIILNRKLLFSRYFKLNRLQSNWEQVFIDEINKSNEAYLKETGGLRPQKIVILGMRGVSEESQEIVSKQLALPIEVLPYDKRISILKNISEDILNSRHSYASLIGLGLTQIPESLKLLPQDTREKNRKVLKRDENLRLILLVFAAVIIFGAAIAKNLDNKRQYLGQLKSELVKVAGEARPLEELENRFKIVGEQSRKKPSSLDILYELHRIIPANISLSSLSYEEDEQVIIHGQTAELDSVFAFVSELEKSTVFKTLAVKVRYATKKKTASGEVVDFQILCSKAN